MSLKQKGGERWEIVYCINRNQVASGKMSLNRKVVMGRTYTVLTVIRCPVVKCL